MSNSGQPEVTNDQRAQHTFASLFHQSSLSERVGFAFCSQEAFHSTTPLPTLPYTLLTVHMEITRQSQYVKRRLLSIASSNAVVSYYRTSAKYDNYLMMCQLLAVMRWIIKFNSVSVFSLCHLLSDV